MAKNKVEMQMVGLDGNAFSILGRFNAAAKQAGWTPQEIKEVTEEATKGDYNHLLATVMNNVDEPDEEEDDEDNKWECDDCGEKWEKWDICRDCDCCPDCCTCDEDDKEEEE